MPRERFPLWCEVLQQPGPFSQTSQRLPQQKSINLKPLDGLGSFFARLGESETGERLKVIDLILGKVIEQNNSSFKQIM